MLLTYYSSTIGFLIRILYASTIAYTCLVLTGLTYGYYHDVYTMKTSPSRYHARLGNMRTTTTT